ncbi:MAG: TIGR01777 family oxidoreductase [Candidatus Nanopelagicales bacterium]
MRIAVTGAGGLIGSALVPHLRRSGHEVVRLVRRPARAADEVSWDPAGGSVDLTALGPVEAVVHLAGAGVGDRRWTDSYKAEIRNSRVQGTDTIARALAAVEPQPRVLVSGSAMGYYGDAGDRVLTEESPLGEGFLAEVVGAWEAAAQPARDAGIRVTHPRTSLVMARDGGAWARMWPLFRLGLGGKLGSGQQWWSWISLRDQVSALAFLIENDLAGPVNLCSPNPVTNDEVTDAMAQLLGTAAPFAVPQFALRMALGEFASEITDSHRMVPARLERAGFQFADEYLADALRSALLRRESLPGT